MSDVEAMQAVIRRLDTVERNHTDLSNTHTHLVQKAAKTDRRLDALENAHQDSREYRAGQVEREKSMQKSISAVLEAVTALQNLNLVSVKEDVTEIKNGANRMFWLIAGAVVTGFSGIIFLLIKGGLNV